MSVVFYLSSARTNSPKAWAINQWAGQHTISLLYGHSLDMDINSTRCKQQRYNAFTALKICMTIARKDLMFKNIKDNKSIDLLLVQLHTIFPVHSSRMCQVLPLCHAWTFKYVSLFRPWMFHSWCFFCSICQSVNVKSSLGASLLVWSRTHYNSSLPTMCLKMSRQWA